MLAFMKDQKLEDATMQDSPGNKPGGPEGQQYFTVATRRKHVRKSTYLLSMVFVVGLMSLIFMIKQSSPQKAEADVDATEVKIEVAIRRITGISTQMFDRMDQIVHEFYEFSNFQQVKVNELVKNPFAYDMLLGTPVATGNEGNDRIDAAALMRQQAILRAKDLKLVSIIKSDTRSCCMINDQIVYQGGSIEGFKVEQITENTVVLVWEQPGSENIQIIMKLTE